MQPLALSSVEDVADYLGIEPTFEDNARLDSALKVGREQITQMVKPVADLPEVLPESLHRACTLRAGAEFSNNRDRYGYVQTDEDATDPTPVRYLIRDLIEPWARPKGGRGPDPRRQLF